MDRRKKIVAAAPASDDFARLLTAAADQFIVARGEQKSVIAGYPWFWRLGPRHHDFAARAHTGHRPL